MVSGDESRPGARADPPRKRKPTREPVEAPQVFKEGVRPLVGSQGSGRANGRSLQLGEKGLYSRDSHVIHETTIVHRPPSEGRKKAGLRQKAL